MNATGTIRSPKKRRLPPLSFILRALAPITQNNTSQIKTPITVDIGDTMMLATLKAMRIPMGSNIVSLEELFDIQYANKANASSAKIMKMDTKIF